MTVRSAWRRALGGPIARGSVRAAIALGIRLVVQTGLLLGIARLLGPLNYGGFSGATALAFAMGTVANLGSNYIVLARMSESNARGVEAWRMAWPLTLATGSVLALIYIATARLLLATTSLPWIALVALAISELLLAPQLANIAAALQGSGRIATSQAVQVLPMILRLLSVLACIVWRPVLILETYSLWHALGMALALGAAWHMVRRDLRLDTSVAWPTRDELKEGMSFAAMAFTAINPTELDKVLVVRVLGLSSGGTYAVATRALAAATTPVIGMLLASQPRLFRHACSDDPGAGTLIRTILLFAAAWGAFAGIALRTVAPLLGQVLGSSYTNIAHTISLTCIVSVPLAVRLACGAIVMAIGRPLWRASFEIVGISILCAAMIVLTPRYGLAGAAAALLISESALMALGLACVNLALRLPRRT